MWLFHVRWARDVDQIASAGRIAASMMAGAGDEQIAAAASQMRERMVDRVWFVGSNEQTGPQIERSFREGLAQLDAHLASRPYLFGARPAFGDFGLWGQIYEAWTDPTGGGLVEGTAPNVLDWIHRMTWPRAEGEFEDWASLEPTLMPFVSGQIGQLFMPWTLANERAMSEGSEEFSVELAGETWTQKPQKYHARSLAALRKKYAAAQGNAELDGILEATGCRRWLLSGD